MKAYKFKIKRPSKAVINRFEQTLDLCRGLYNAALQERIGAWKEQRISITRFDQANQLPEIKKTCPEYKEVYSQILGDVLNRLDKTFKSFFSRVKKGEKTGFPRFKGQNRFDSFCFPQKGFSLKNDKLTLSKIGTMRIHLSREIVGTIKTCIIKREVDGWFVVFTVEDEKQPLPKTGQSVGLDVGIENFVTLSDGTQIDNSRFFESAQKKLRVAQRRVSRRKKGGNQRRKAVFQLRKIHAKIQNQRNDFQHQISTRLVKEYDLIAIEDLNVVGLSKGILSKQVHDVAWSGFFSKLKYKAENADKMLNKVRPHFTSQDCSACGERAKKDLSLRVHHCLVCGLRLHRDHNAAKNILKSALGQSVEELTYAVGQSVSLESLSNLKRL